MLALASMPEIMILIYMYMLTNICVCFGACVGVVIQSAQVITICYSGKSYDIWSDEIQYCGMKVLYGYKCSHLIHDVH